MHLPGFRRDQFRAAFQGLLATCGVQTHYGEPVPLNDCSASQTSLAPFAEVAPVEMGCWLADSEYIHPLKVGFNTLGRLSENDVVLSDACISRRHCAILVHHSKLCELHDIASTNGT